MSPLLPGLLGLCMEEMLVSFPTASDGVSVICEFQQNDCTVDYQVVLSGPYNIMGRVFVGEERGGLATLVISSSYVAVRRHKHVSFLIYLQTVRNQIYWDSWSGSFLCQ